MGVPIPASIPRPLVDAARAMMNASKPKELTHPAREWELRGLLRCSCGWKMGTHTARSGGNGKTYSYYACNRRRLMGKDCGCTQKAIPAEKLEEAVWQHVFRLLSTPEELVAGLDRKIEQERMATGGDPERELRAWLIRIEELDHQRERAQAGYLAGAFSVAELKDTLARLDEQRRAAEKEADACRNRRGRVSELERVKDALLARKPLYLIATGGGDHRADTPEEKRGVYRQHSIGLNITPEGGVMLDGAIGEQVLCTTETLSRTGSAGRPPAETTGCSGVGAPRATARGG